MVVAVAGSLARPFRAAMLAAIVAFGSGMSAAAQRVVVIGDDRGGYVGERAQLVASLRADAARVEIRGSICFSACTMYLGAGDVCVSPETRFGFHGPSRFGQALSTLEFEHWSEVMARHYAEPLRQWFMEGPRYESRTLIEVSGAELIRLGYAAC
jgi:hypothetical protein